VVYEIYPRSFADGDGDLRGVIAHLDQPASGPDGPGVPSDPPRTEAAAGLEPRLAPHVLAAP
jgi:hypothetical protein